VQVDGDVVKTAYKARTRTYKAVVQSDPQPSTPNIIATPVKWTLKVGTKKVRTVEQSWADKDTLTYRLPQKKTTKTYKIRLFENGESAAKKTVTVKGTG
jgi:hypothetical protein